MSQGTYEPGKRHWLKVKKDYLNEGAMADTADLVVLGAFYGTGSKGVYNCPIAVCNVHYGSRMTFNRNILQIPLNNSMLPHSFEAWVNVYLLTQNIAHANMSHFVLRRWNHVQFSHGLL